MKKPSSNWITNLTRTIQESNAETGEDFIWFMYKAIHKSHTDQELINILESI